MRGRRRSRDARRPPLAGPPASRRRRRPGRRRAARRCALADDLRFLRLPRGTAARGPGLVPSRGHGAAALAHAPVGNLAARTRAPGPPGRDRPRRPARTTALSTGALLGVVLLSAVQINVYFGLNHTVSDLTGHRRGADPAAGRRAETRAREPLPASAWPSGTRRPSCPTAACCGAPQSPAPASGFESREAYIYLPPAYRATPAAGPSRPGPLRRPARRAGGLAHRRGAAQPHGPVRGGAPRRGPGGGGGGPQRLRLGQHPLHGQQDRPGRHLPRRGRAGLDQPDAGRGSGPLAVGGRRILLRRDLRDADGDPAPGHLQLRAGLFQREGTRPRQGAGEDHRRLLRRRHRSLRPPDTAAAHAGQPLRRACHLLRRR